MLYEYDSNGNVVSETRNGAETTYTYDSLDRLLSVTYSDGSSVTYEYDALNNRTKETYSNGDVKDYVYDAKYQLKEIKLNGHVTDTFTYNESGAVVTHNDKEYTYDEWDRMSGYSDGTDIYTYKYDANGIRTQKNDKQYIIDINNNVVAETDSTGTITDEILWGYQPLARKVNGSWYYYIYNAHGDVVGLVNDSGTVVNTYEYTPWGEIRNETETIDNPIKYAGEYYDDELGMIYLRARYYNPNIGRFTSLDIEEGEISNPLDMNRYVYCRNNPIKYVDPSGESYTNTIIDNGNGNYTVTTNMNVLWTNLEFEYTISNGVVRFDFSKNDYWSVLWRGGGKELAEAAYNAAKSISTDYLSGRTVGGLNTEIQLHWAAYVVGIKKENARVADAGGMIRGNPGYDSNAWFFQGAQAGKIVTKLNIFKPSGIKDLLKEIGEYLQ